MTKLVADIISSQDGEEAFIAVMQMAEFEEESEVSQHDRKALGELARQWLAGHDKIESTGAVYAMISSDENRKRLILTDVKRSGFGVLIESFQDEDLRVFYSLFLSVFLEVCDDPGYFDELLDLPTGTLTDAQRLQLLDRKRQLG